MFKMTPTKKITNNDKRVEILRGWVKTPQPLSEEMGDYMFQTWPLFYYYCGEFAAVAINNHLLFLTKHLRVCVCMYKTRINTAAVAAAMFFRRRNRWGGKRAGEVIYLFLRRKFTLHTRIATK